MVKDLSTDNDFIKNEFNAVFRNNGDKMTSGYFLANYKTIIPRYISNGKPSEDTLNSYFSAIDQFISWAEKIKIAPLAATEQQMLYYRSLLISKDYKSTSVKFKLTCLRRFFYIAMKYKLVNDNPLKDVHANRDPDSYIPILQFLSVGQLRKLITEVSSDQDEKTLRAKAMIYLMAVEGLRTVEVHRMNIQDINFDLKTIYIRGKGHNDMVYPTDDTMKALYDYIKIRVHKPTYPTPVFTSMSNVNKGLRLSRNKIRDNINEFLTKAELKVPGKACHLLRHTCGTLLYSKTKDLQVVKSVLRHRNVEMTSRYSHVQDGMIKRYTSAIPIKPLENE